MPSVLAIVSKAVFEKMAPKGVAVGTVIDTNRYTSSNPAFEQLANGDAIFLVTVRPPDETLWLVGILERPARKDTAWVAKANTAPIRDITPAIKKLVFVSGTGLKARKGALGMSLQTPRVLTPEDVSLLRGGAAVAYREAVEQVPAAAKARAQAAKAARGGLTLRFVNHRRPFETFATLPAAQNKQLKLLAKNNEAGPIAKLVHDPDWAPMELVDVVENATGKRTHQMYVWPYGCGSVFENDTTNQIGIVIQHAYQLTEGDLPLRTALAAAYASASPQLSELVDFRLDEEAAPIGDYEAGLKRIEGELGQWRDGIRAWSDLSAVQQALLRGVLGSRTEDAYGLGHLGIPMLPALRRWMELEPAGPLEKVVAGRTIATLLREAISDGKALRTVATSLSAVEVAAVCMEIAQHDPYYLFTTASGTTERKRNAYAVEVIRALAGLIDASGDDAALAFAKNAAAHLAKKAEFWLAAIATFAVAARAHRKKEAFPPAFQMLATKADFLGNSCHLHMTDAWDHVVKTVPEDERAAFLRAVGGRPMKGSARAAR